MRLTRFEVRGFKNLSASACLDELGAVNIIHGDNNVGKSNLLEAIALVFELLGKPSRPTGGIGQMVVPFPDPWEFGTTEWTEQTPGFPAPFIFHLTAPQPIELSARFQVEADEWRTAGLDLTYRTVEISWRIKRTLDRIHAGIHSVRFDDRPAEFTQDHAPPILRHLMRFFTQNDQARPVERRFVSIDTDRTAHPALDPPSLWLALYDAKESLDPVHYGRWNLFVQTTQRFHDILGPGQFVPTYDRQSGRASLAFQTDKTRIPYFLLGTGIQQLVTLVGLLLMSNATIVAIEEPELNLRYSLQKRLRDVFEEIANADTGPSQIFICSHSPAFETGDHFYHLQHSPDGPTVTRRPIADAPMATAHTFDQSGPRGRAPLSYVTSEGLVQLPSTIRKQLGVEQGGGIVVLKRKARPYVELLTNEQFIEASGLGDANRDDGHEPG